MKNPLHVFVAYHSDFSDGKTVFQRLYKDLCQDSRALDSSGLGIPVRFCTGNDDGVGNYFSNINQDNSDKIFLLLLIDIKMFNSAKWRSEVTNLFNIEKSNIHIQPVRLSRYANDFPSLQTTQFFHLDSFSITDNWEKFRTLLYDALIRLLKMKETENISIFISHSKHDFNKTGEETATAIRNYLMQNTVLNSFFDRNNILPGEEWDKRIKVGVKNAILMVLFTNTYSSREWCRREMLTAKKEQIPAIALFLVDGDIERVFPYIGNIPGTTLDLTSPDWQKPLNLLLRTTLKQYHNEAYLTAMINPDEFDALPYTPEAFSFAILDKSKKVIYPDPPLCPEETEILRKIASTQFLTPSTYLAAGINLSKKQIAISISESDNLDSFGYDRMILDDIMVSLTRHLLLANASLAYGGDLRKSGYTELLRDISYQYGLKEASDGEVFYFHNYLPCPPNPTPTDTEIESYIHSHVRIITVSPPDDCKDISYPDINGSMENRYLIGRTLSKMRDELEGKSFATILLGGKRVGFSGTLPGVLEEFSIAMAKKHPIYLIGAFGGITGDLARIIEKRIDSSCLYENAKNTFGYEQLLSYFDSKGFPIDYTRFEQIQFLNLNNGLSDEDNTILFHSSNVTEIISLILKGLNSLSL